MKMILLATLLLAFTACKPSEPTPVDPSASPTPSPISQVGCAVETSLASAMATGISVGLACTGTDAIKADILAAAGKANLCSTSSTALATLQAARAQKLMTTVDDVQKQKAVLGAIVCPLLVTTLQKAALAQVPQKWNCGGGVTVDALVAKATALCVANVPF